MELPALCRTSKHTALYLDGLINLEGTDVSEGTLFWAQICALGTKIRCENDEKTVIFSQYDGFAS
ncbi:hypothetical protein TcasGA2_TC015968 [Tribolium castaneum]|uniref:Uncharacterized protein n=1 Tax=Tribolium castaneum TaxID=7070 RepID=D7GXJ2_TRICA|nr:hypothetical protein TcasGA2_TC015968 [Tribolium castaneum]